MKMQHSYGLYLHAKGQGQNEGARSSALDLVMRNSRERFDSHAPCKLICAMLLEEITMPAFSQGLATTRTVLIPFGSVEEHGGHLPLGTDTIHAYELGKQVAGIHPIFVAPPVWYGLCRSTNLHPGTIGISGDTLKRLALDIVSGFYHQGCRNFVFLSGHAGGTHMAFLTDAGEQVLSRFPDSRVAVVSVLDVQSQMPGGIIETPGDSHAGEVETSLMLYLRNHLVDGTSPEEYPVFPKYILVRDKLRYWPGGVWGNPQKASSSKGATIMEKEALVLASLVKRLEELQVVDDSPL